MGNPYYCERCYRKPRKGTWEYCSRECAAEAELDAKKQVGGGWVSGALKGLVNAVTMPLDEINDFAYGRPPKAQAKDAPGPGPDRANSSVSRPSQSGRSQDVFPDLPPNTRDGLCEFCHLKPKFQDKDGGTSPFCGRTCRNLHAQLTLKFCGLKECGRPLTSRQNGFCSDKHARNAVLTGDAAACAYCKVWPTNPPHGYCTKECGIRDQIRRAALIKPLTLLNPGDPLYSQIESRFTERWNDAAGRLQQPAVHAILQINLPKKYEIRFTDAAARADTLGGSTTKSAFYGGQCICDVGVMKDELCSWPSCSICTVVRKGFDVLEFGTTEHVGSLGKGIYANLNPMMAHRFTVKKAAHPFRAVILCSVLILDDFVKGERKKSSAVVEGNGRVYCSKKEFIIPRHLIIYNEPPTLP